ncbi:Hsp20/alpha crystallin family protein [Archangium primigenium]|uniref:Hsp20/alpha crystallin family protein n=1 Tax=[Archangium] primigenium TaxID=2792470 RepID=UPI001958734F|nr:Hsp20/alpha crystallin family protein [Archangium primigenium]MBM7118981.1 Hsp20/alpha crystallin family protein [Archangium primigenium]
MQNSRWNPFETSNGAVALGPLVMREFDQLFRDLSVRQTGAREFIPAADIFESAEGITLQVDLPGHDAKSIQVRVENDTLTLTSERKRDPSAETQKTEGARRLERGFGVYTRSFALPRTVDASRVEARYDNGVLTLTLPRREETKPRVVEVKVNG